MRKKSGSAFARMMFTLAFAAAFAVFFPCEARAADDEAVFLPSRFAGSSGPAAAGDAVQAAPRAPVRAPINVAALAAPPHPRPEHSAGGNRARFVHGGTRPRITCQVGKTADIELEPGERVEKFFVTEGEKWSVSASWSGVVDNFVTHVLLRTFFPGVKSSLTILTDRRVYEMELVSGLDVDHMAYIGFIYPGAREEKPEETEPPGRYRDLLVKYGIIEGAVAEEERKARRVDAAELNFRYAIKPLGGKKPSWTPREVYDADGRTYMVLSRPRRGTGRPSLYIVNKDIRTIAKTTELRDDLYVVDRVFDEAILKHGADEVSISRLRP